MRKDSAGRRKRTHLALEGGGITLEEVGRVAQVCAQ